MQKRGLVADGRAKSVLLPVLLATTALSGISAVSAQPAGEGGLETVIVTAQKREENVQRVPMNVQVLSTEKLENLHLNDFTEFALYMPSVNYAVSGQGSSGGPGFSNITMRGIASDQNGNHSGPLPTVGVYLDEQPITTINGTLDIPTFDVERVEALSGPQGTLYGASSEAGTIRIITNKPDPSEFSAGYRIEGNAVDHGSLGYVLYGFVNQPLDDNVAIRIVAWNEHDAGYIDNVHRTRTYPTSGITIDNAGRVKSNYNTVNKFGGRAALRIDLDDSWTVTPSFMGELEKTNGIFGFDSTIGDLKIGHFLPDYTKDKWYQAALTVQGKIWDLDLMYAGAYMQRTIRSQADYTDYSYWYDTLFGYGAYFYDNAGNLVDPSQYIVGKDRFTKESHEIRVSSSKEDRLRFLAGAFYERQTHFILQDYKVVGDIADSISVTGWPDTIWLTDQKRIDRDYALFGEVSFDILPNLTLTGGLRYFKAVNSLAGFYGFAAGFSSNTGEAKCFLPYAIVDRGPCTNLRATVREEGETHRVNLTWQIDDNRMVYATYSTGFRPGGINRRTDICEVINGELKCVGPYSSDSLDNYEIGWKTSWDDNRLRFNGDIFWDRWNNFQFPFLGPNSVTIIKNVGQATSKGVEAEISWLPIDNLTLSGSGAYTEATLSTDYCGGDCGVNPVQAPEGTQLPITPKWKLNATARYQWYMGDFLGHAQGSVVHESGRWVDLRFLERNLLGKAKAFTTFDFTLGVDKDNWTVELALLNAFDERAQLGRYAECTPGTCGFETYILSDRPRTIALSFAQKF